MFKNFLYNTREIGQYLMCLICYLQRVLLSDYRNEHTCWYWSSVSDVSNAGLIEMYDKMYGICIVVKEIVVYVLVIIQNEYGILVIKRDQDTAEVKC